MLAYEEAIIIRQAKNADAEAIANIYNYYVENTVVTFEEEKVTARDIISRFGRVKQVGLPWLVAEEKGEIIGYAYATKWKDRSAYRHTAEITVYLSHYALSKGRGTKLYEALFCELRRASIHVVIGAITLPNPASIALHEKLGMEKVAHYKEVGFKFGEWLDVGYWQKQITA